MSHQEPSEYEDERSALTRFKAPNEKSNNKKDSAKPTEREWLPEDDDDWYEPDYCPRDRRTH